VSLELANGKDVIPDAVAALFIKNVLFLNYCRSVRRASLTSSIPAKSKDKNKKISLLTEHRTPNRAE
jgi:hypothetical protein